MRFLKRKISLAQQLKTNREREKTFQMIICTSDQKLSAKEKVRSLRMIRTPTTSDDSEIDKSSSNSHSPKTPEKIRCTKNIVKNYGRAIAKFACSEMALVYLMPLLSEHNLEYPEAMAFFVRAKTKIQGIDTFRALILEHPQDDSKEATFKILFVKMGEAFIKYFSVNWIFHSKILHRSTYLKYRFKMLRRLQSPELFTYLKG